jgi:hypothetical protein
MAVQNTTNIPAPRVPFIDERTGLISREWFRFLNNQFQLTGGGTTAISLADLELAPYSDAATEAELAVTQSRVQALELAPRSPEPTPVSFGSFFSSQTQAATAINTAKAISYNNTNETYGIYLDPSDNTKVKVSKPAIYNVQFSIQVDKTSGGTGNFYIWAAINGTAVPNSGCYIQIQGNNAEIFSAANYFLPLSNGDHFQLYFSVSDLSVQLQHFAASAPVPAIPSIILTVMQVYI